jgi:hypothetical protein
LSDRVVIPPTAGILESARLLGSAVYRFIKAIKTCEPIGRYEWQVESRLLVLILMRGVEAICELARSDLCLLHGAVCISRQCLELAARILWMLQPTEPFDREARFLAHLASEESSCLREAKILGDGSPEAQWLLDRASAFQTFRKGVENLLPVHVMRIDTVPHLRAMLCDIGHESIYRLYVQTSQFAHGTHIATGVYRRNLGTVKEIGEYISATNWYLPLSCVWWAFREAGIRVITATGGDVAVFCDNSFDAAVRAAQVEAQGSP